MIDEVTAKILIAILGSSVLTTIINRIFVVQDRKKQKEDATTIGVRALLQIEIKRLGKDYIAEGCIDLEDRRELVNLWNIYHDSLGGNGYLDAVMSEVNALPLRTDSKHNV